jgi:hypothetical protein
MKSHRLGSALVCASSVLAFAALTPACGSSGAGSFFDKDSGKGGGPGDNGGDDSGSIQGDDDGGHFDLDGGTPPPALDGGCATATAAASRSPVYMLLVLDGSGSMNGDNKWTAAKDALDNVFDQIKTENDNSFGVGLNIFSDKNDATCGGPTAGNTCGPYPLANDVGIAFVDGAQNTKLKGRVDGTGPSGGTPTYAALSGGWGELEKFTPAAPLQAGGKKVLVIMTDGVPTNDKCAGPDPFGLGLGGDPSICWNGAQTEVSKSILTFVVGVGPFPSTNAQNYDPVFLGKLAQAGGASPAGCNPSETSNASKLCYFQITPNGKPATQLAQDFINAINAIRGQVASCEFNLQATGGQVDPNKVNVVYTDANGVEHVLVQDPQNGWTYDDPTNPTKVILHGTDCTEVKGDPKGKIKIVLGCATQKAK